MHGHYYIADWIPDDAAWQIGLAALGILGTILGYLIGRRNERNKDRAESDMRRVEFVAWLRALKAESEKRVLGMHGFGFELNWPIFTQGIPEFISACELVRVEIPKNRLADFDSVVAYLSQCGPRNFRTEESCNEVYASIDRLVAIVRP